MIIQNLIFYFSSNFYFYQFIFNILYIFLKNYNKNLRKKGKLTFQVKKILYIYFISSFINLYIIIFIFIM